MPPARWLETGGCRRAAGMVRARRARSRRRCSASCCAATPALGRSDVAADAAGAGRGAAARRSCRRCARDPEFARAPTWDGHAGRDRRAGAACATHPLVAALARAIRQRGRHADRRAARGACAAAAGVDRSRRAADAPSARASACRSATAKDSPRCETARGLLLHRARLRDGTRRRLPDRRADRMELPSRRRARRAASTGLDADDERDARCARRGSRCRRSIPASPAGSRSAMHEMALAEGMLQIVEDAARAQRARRASRTVWLELGALSHVEPDALRLLLRRGDARQRRRRREARDRDDAGRGLVHAAAASACRSRGWASLPALRQLPAAGRRRATRCG